MKKLIKPTTEPAIEQLPKGGARYTKPAIAGANPPAKPMKVGLKATTTETTEGTRKRAGRRGQGREVPTKTTVKVAEKKTKR